jgi:hypothetical protein
LKDISFAALAKIHKQEVSVGVSTVLGQRSQIGVLRPASGSEADLGSFVTESAVVISEELRRFGALILRGFDRCNETDFAEIVRRVDPTQPRFVGGASPRQTLADGVYTSTDYSNAFPIQFHSEFSYASEWPRRLWFYCLEPAITGGRTPVSDNRVIAASIASDIFEEFVRKGLVYVRRYDALFGVSWRDAFGVVTRDDLTPIIEGLGIEAEWTSDEQLETRQRFDAALIHPITLETVWFNHALFFHLGGLEPPSLRAELELMEPAERPYDLTFGDGSRIPIEYIEHLRETVWNASVAADWEPGDLLVLDNMLVSHAREPFEGDRRIAVGMTERVARRDVETVRIAR